MTGNRGLPAGQHYPPLDLPRVATRLLGGAMALMLALLLAGWALSELAALEVVTDWEDAASRWFVAHESATWDSVSAVASQLADTRTCVAVLVVAALLLRWWLGRWRESLVMAVSLAGEVLIFLAVGALVGRERPDVRHLDEAPPTSSFPSGHTAAAVVLYGALAVILWRQLARRHAAVVVVGLLLVPVAVGLARLYRGMHHPSDVLFGALMGGLWLWLVVRTLLPAANAAPDDAPLDEQGEVAATPVQRIRG